MADKKCSKCGTVFGCKNEERGCWCEQHEIPLKTLEYLKKNYDNCLCPRCLAEFAVVEVKK